jgi:hypothetical protein
MRHPRKPLAFQTFLVGGIALLGPLGCSQTDSPGDMKSVDAGIDALAVAFDPTRPCGYDTSVGGFKFTMNGGDGFSGFQGSVFSGPGALGFFETRFEAGGCRVLVKSNPFCATPCSGEQQCSVGGECVAIPRQQAVGTVTVSGLATALMVNPGMSNFYNYAGDLPFPLAAPGILLSLTVQGAGAIKGFSLEARGIALLEGTSADPIAAGSTRGLDLVWTAPSDMAGASRIRLFVNVDNHGSSSARVECDVSDSGTFTVPQAVMSRLLALGATGFPTVTLTRYSAAATRIDAGCVDFSVVSSRTQSLNVDGVLSCHDDMECPDGQQCVTPAQICKPK